MPTSCNAKPQRGVTMVASRFNGWYKAARKKRAFRYATSNLAERRAEMAGRSTLVASYLKNHCQMPTASLPKLEPYYIYVRQSTISGHSWLPISPSLSRYAPRHSPLQPECFLHSLGCGFRCCLRQLLSADGH